jgi:hypothetical protein
MPVDVLKGDHHAETVDYQGRRRSPFWMMGEIALEPAWRYQIVPQPPGMPIFHKTAYLAACRQKPPSQLGKLTDAHFEDDVQLEEALGWLSAEQLCDALYGDWLLQLDSPGGPIQLQVRNLLIGQGALAANYLAELAQNADDAADGRAAEVRITLEGEWLIVGNDGRKVTPGNLRGLCRFFVHRAGKVRQLDADTIGRFGIGFKSCYRIASEVLVRSWDADGEFAFRLPISREADEHSWPAPEALDRVTARLRAERVPVSARVLKENCLGYCTPEHLQTWPTDLPAAAMPSSRAMRGTIFCFRLHDAGAREVRSRISGQAHELYELCPLFLPNVRTVQIGDSTLEMSIGRLNEKDGIAGQVSARTVTLTTTHDGKSANDTFWKLTGISPEDRWQIALHADSKGRLNLAKVEQAALSLREGGAYAYFPLNDVNRSFPFRFHLHIDLPTDLKRGDWNPDERQNVFDQLGRAAAGLTNWLEAHAAKRHQDWRFEQLFRGEPAPADEWAQRIFSALRDGLQQRALLRTVWGELRRGADVRTLTLPSSNARQGWKELCTALPHLSSAFPFVLVDSQVELGLTAAKREQTIEFFAAAAKESRSAPEFWRHYLTAAVGTELLGGPELEKVFERVIVTKQDGSKATLRQVMEQPTGAELMPVWHECFGRLYRSVENDHQRRGIAVFGEALGTKLSRLSSAVFFVDWAEVATKLPDLDSWNEHGDRFWTQSRLRCPYELREEVIASLRIKDGSGRWKLLTQVWLLDNSPVKCFQGVVGQWDRGQAVNNQLQIARREKLHTWGLLDAYQDAVETRLENELGDRLLQLCESAGDDPFEPLHAPAHVNSRKNLEARWRRIVEESEREAITRFLQKQQGGLTGATFVATSIPWPTRRVIEFLPTYKDAPRWLSDKTLALIEERGVRDGARISLVAELTADKRTEIARELLSRFYLWKDETLDAAAIAALDELFADVRGTWAIALARNRSAILENLYQRTGDDEASRALECMLSHSGKVVWHADFLPEPLPRIRPIAKICPGAADLHLEMVLPGDGLPVSFERVHPNVTGPIIAVALRALSEWKVCYHIPLRPLWKVRGQPVCEIKDAAFVLDGGRLIVSRLAGAFDDRQYGDVLAMYARCAPEDDEFSTARRGDRPALALYTEFRGRILAKLRAELVIDEGYTERHVLRELLQNAESAYASKAGALPEKRHFTVRVRSLPKSGAAVEVEHCGRTFNAPDHEEQRRPDIKRIISARAESQNTAEEVGRFNRGFKSVFTVTERVAVRSGGYSFEIEDLLILHPAEPEPDSATEIAETRFTFQCSKADANKLLGSTGPRPFQVFHAATFVFLKFLNEITLEHDGERRQWRVERRPLDEDWTEVVVTEPIAGGRERFLVFSSISRRADAAVPRRFGAAIRLDVGSGAPITVEQTWNKLFLTFPTDSTGPFGFLINADFLTDRGRVEVRRHSINETLLKAALNAVLERLQGLARIQMSRAEWLGWARVLRVRDSLEWLRSTFPEDSQNIQDPLLACAQTLARRVPHGGRLVPREDLIVPSRLMRGLAASPYAEAWGIETEEWIDTEVEREIQELPIPKRPWFTLDDFIARRRSDTALMGQIASDLRDPRFREQLTPDATGHQEIQVALASFELQVTLQPVVQQPLFSFHQLSLTEVLEWWESHEAPDDYILEGNLWSLLHPKALPIGTEARRAQLSAELSSPTTDVGRRLWYRVLSFACLLGAGQPVTRVQKFWNEKLDPLLFWEKTDGSFDAAGEIFDDIIHREFKSASAAGEDATFWRRVFYDIQKVNRLVFEDQFAETVIDLAKLNAERLVQFLRSGQLPGQPGWRGVLGQSAGSPLFFVVRELRRLRVITYEAVDSSAFFVCTPVRRLAARLSWVSPELAARYDFESLQETSRRIYEKASESDCAELFAEWFDIPLLHYALNHSI